MDLLLQKLFSLTGNGAHVHLLVYVQASTTPTYTDEVKTGEQIMLLNRFWDEHSPAFFIFYEFIVACVLQLRVIVKQKMQERQRKAPQREKTNLRQRCAAC